MTAGPRPGCRSCGKSPVRPIGSTKLSAAPSTEWARGTGMAGQYVRLEAISIGIHARHFGGNSQSAQKKFLTWLGERQNFLSNACCHYIVRVIVYRLILVSLLGTAGCTVVHLKNADGSSQTRFSLLSPVIVISTSTDAPRFVTASGIGIGIIDGNYALGLFTSSVALLNSECRVVLFVAPNSSSIRLAHLVKGMHEICVHE